LRYSLDGHPALRSTASSGSSSALAVSSFRLRARLDVCLPSGSSGQRGITPACWIRRPSFGRQRDFNPPEQRAAQHALRSSPPLADALVLSASRFCRLCLFPYHRQPGSQVPYESPDQIHAPSAPDTAWPVSRSPAILLPGPRVNPGFDVVIVLFRCFTQRFACAHLSSPHMTRSQPRLLTLTFTTTVIEPKQLKAV
jgi:hypothetical protein